MSNNYKIVLVFVFVILFAAFSYGDSLQKIVESSIKRECYYEPRIHLGDSLFNLNQLKINKLDEYSVESQAFYDYGKYSLGFNTSLMGMDGDSKIIKIVTINYKIDLKYSDIENVFAEKGNIYTFWEYGTFLLEIKKDNVIFTFWPKDVEETMKRYEARIEDEKLLKEVIASIDKYSFGYLDVTLEWVHCA